MEKNYERVQPLSISGYNWNIPELAYSLSYHKLYSKRAF